MYKQTIPEKTVIWYEFDELNDEARENAMDVFLRDDDDYQFQIDEVWNEVTSVISDLNFQGDICDHYYHVFWSDKTDLFNDNYCPIYSYELPILHKPGLWFDDIIDDYFKEYDHFNEWYKKAFNQWYENDDEDPLYEWFKSYYDFALGLVNRLIDCINEQIDYCNSYEYAEDYLTNVYTDTLYSYDGMSCTYYDADFEEVA